MAVVYFGLSRVTARYRNIYWSTDSGNDINEGKTKQCWPGNSFCDEIKTWMCKGIKVNELLSNLLIPAAYGCLMKMRSWNWRITKRYYYLRKINKWKYQDMEENMKKIFLKSVHSKCITCAVCWQASFLCMQFVLVRPD